MVNLNPVKPRMQFIVATHNPHKTREIEQILGPGYDVRDLTAHPEISEIVEETGTDLSKKMRSSKRWQYQKNYPVW